MGITETLQKAGQALPMTTLGMHSLRQQVELPAGNWALDVALFTTCTLLAFTHKTIFLFHLVFVLLTLGAFYWQLKGFILRVCTWVLITTAILIYFILAGDLHADELIEIPMLTTILLCVFLIARRRSFAEEKLREIIIRQQAEVARELERMRIGRDLHDSVGQSLAYLHLQLDNLTNNATNRNDESSRMTLEQLRDVAHDAYEQVRDILNSLLPVNSADLAAELQKQSQLVRCEDPFRIQLNCTGMPIALSATVQQQIGYIYREALNNIATHAQANQVNVTITWKPKMLALTIVDNGCGFDVHRAFPCHCYGLRIMHERAKQISGKLTISSIPTVGTTLTLQVTLAQ